MNHAAYHHRHRRANEPANQSQYHAARNKGEIQLLMNAIPKDLQLVTITADCPMHGKREWHISAAAAKAGKTGCQKCRWEKEAREEAMNDKRAALMFSVDMPDEHIAASFDSWLLVGDNALKERMGNIISFAKGYSATYKKGHANILLTGNTGTGKTKLACLIANEIIRRRYSEKLSIVFKTSADIQREAKDGWNAAAPEKEVAYMARLARASVLIIDEVGEGDTGFSDKAADADRERLSGLINKRYQAGLPTIITTNKSAIEFCAHVGDRAADRLKQNLVDIPCNWRSFRDATRRIQTF